MSLAVMFIGLGAVTLLAALFAFWQSLRAAFGAADLRSVQAATGSVERQALTNEKAVLLDSIKDLEFEKDVGKISDSDFDKTDAQLRARAREVLKLLDQDVKPYRKKAEQILNDHLKKSGGSPYRDQGTDKETGQSVSPQKSCWSCETKNDDDADWCKSCAARLSPRECPSCSVSNDPDAAFCKKCAHRFEDVSADGAKDDQPGPEPDSIADEEATDDPADESSDASEVAARSGASNAEDDHEPSSGDEEADT